MLVPRLSCGEVVENKVVGTSVDQFVTGAIRLDSEVSKDGVSTIAVPLERKFLSTLSRLAL